MSTRVFVTACFFISGYGRRARLVSGLPPSTALTSDSGHWNVEPRDASVIERPSRGTGAFTEWQALAMLMLAFDPAGAFTAPARAPASRGINVGMLSHVTSKREQASLELSRRHALTNLIAPLAIATATGLGLKPGIAGAAMPAAADVTTYMKEVQEALKPLPGLLQAEEWDKVRTVLKIKCGPLWNLGDAKNPLVTFAKKEGIFELVEPGEELALAFQLADQFTYDNVYIPFQPGNGKVRIKEPTDQLKTAQKKVDEILQILSEL